MSFESDFSNYLEAVATAADETSSPVNLRTTKQEASFASIDNLDTCIAFINSALGALNLPSPLTFFDPTTEDIINTINSIHGLLQLRQSEISRTKDLEANITKLSSEKHTLLTKLKLSEREVQQSQSQLAQTEQKFLRLKEEYQFLQRRSTSDREAYTRTVSSLEQRDVQHTHQVKKLELANSKLQSRLDGFIRNQNQSINPIVTSSRPLIDPLAETFSPRKKWNQNEEGPRSSVLSAPLEKRNLDLLRENNQLRQLLKESQQSSITFAGQNSTSSDHIYELPYRVGKSPMLKNTVSNQSIEGLIGTLIHRIDGNDDYKPLANILSKYSSQGNSSDFNELLNCLDREQEELSQRGSFSLSEIATPGIGISSPLRELENCLDDEG
ncbi:hypothetical protein P9112_011326 [Eukaryota sp. TZLM1-RC]